MKVKIKSCDGRLVETRIKNLAKYLASRIECWPEDRKSEALAWAEKWAVQTIGKIALHLYLEIENGGSDEF
jgi:hypothetical protein